VAIWDLKWCIGLLEDFQHKAKMRLYFNSLVGEWFATRAGKILFHSKSLDDTITMAIIEISNGKILSSL